MIDTATVAAYRAHRQRNVPAGAALHAARNRPEQAMPGIVWDTDRSGNPHGTGTHDGFDIEIKLTFDDDPMIDGSFSDTRTDSAIQNPNWKPRSDVLRWYDPMSTVEEHRAGLRQIGYGRHDAWVTAMRYVRADAMSDAQPEHYICTVTASRNDVVLAECTVHGISVDQAATGDDTRQVLIGTAYDVLLEAVSDAADALAKLIPAPAVAGQLVIFRVMDLSTAHLPEEICRDLNGYDGVIAHKLPAGWLLWVPAEDIDTRAEEYDLPAEIVTVLRFARQNDCTYVMLDRDASTIYALPTWEW